MTAENLELKSRLSHMELEHIEFRKRTEKEIGELADSLENVITELRKYRDERSS